MSSEVELIAKHLQITCAIEIGNGQHMNIKMKNSSGNFPIKKGNWSLYLYSMHDLRVSVRHMNTFTLKHVVGSLFTLDPGDEFYTMVPDSSLDLVLISDNEITNRHQLFPNWYIASETKCAILESTRTMDFVSGINSSKPKHVDVTRQFKYPSHIDVENYIATSYKDIITPTPSHSDQFAEDGFSFNANEWVACGEISHPLLLTDVLGINMSDTPETEEKCVFFEKCESIKSESYEININPERIHVKYCDGAGEYYSITTLHQMIRQENVYCGKVKDSPAFGYRGLHVDVSRNFRSADEICRIIRAMAAFKLNVLHLHLTDDEGWRIEIDGLPELTEIGAQRSHFSPFLEPQLGSGPFDDTSGTGYYTSEDYKIILSEARKRHVKVIPELDMPGHCYAAIKAMDHRYSKYMQLGNEEKAMEFLPVDRSDAQDIESVQMYDRNSLNPCIGGTWRFIEHVILSLKKLHEDIQPLEIFHIGADEVPDGVWDKSQACKSAFPETTNMWTDVQTLFLQKANEICKKHDIAMALWADGLTDAEIYNKETSPELAVAWRISLKNEKYNPYKLANTGQKIVVASATHVYFDHKYEDTFEERGLNWATKWIDTKKVFDMNPLDMYSCLEKNEDATHEKLICNENIVGVQAHVWSETIRTEQQFHEMLFPRLIAFAENSWNAGENKCESWEKFAVKLSKYELPRLEKLKIGYRIAPPIIKITDSNVECYTDLPGYKIMFQKTGSTEWRELSSPTELKGDFTFKVKSNTTTSLAVSVTL